MITRMLRKVAARVWRGLPQKWRSTVMREVVAVLVGGDAGKIERVDVMDKVELDYTVSDN